MIYKIQRLFSKKDKGQENNQQQTQQASQGNTEPKPKKTERFKSIEEAQKANDKKYLDELAEINGHTASVDESGKRRTLSQIKAEHDTRTETINAYKQELKRQKRQEKIDKAKQKVKNATDKTKAWTKKNKKGLIIGGSVLAAGTGAAVVGSKINKKNKENKIKKDVRGY